MGRCQGAGVRGRNPELRLPLGPCDSCDASRRLASSLCGQELAAAAGRGGDETRFGMLADDPGVRTGEAGRRRGKTRTARRAHAAYFLGLAERAWPAFRQRAGQEPWLDRLEAERANFRAALAWLDESGDVASLLGLAGALSWFWYIRGPLGEGRSWLERALAAQDADVPGARAARAMVGAGLLAHFQGDDEQARTWLEASLAWSSELDDPWLLAFTRLLLGMVAEDHGDYHLAEARFAEALTRFRAADDRSNAALTLTHLGVAAWGQGDVERAAKLCQEAMALQRATKDDWGLSISLGYLGLLAGEARRLRLRGSRPPGKPPTAMGRRGLGRRCRLPRRPGRARRGGRAAAAGRPALRGRRGRARGNRAMAHSAPPGASRLRASRATSTDSAGEVRLCRGRGSWSGASPGASRLRGRRPRWRVRRQLSKHLSNRFLSVPTD